VSGKQRRNAGLERGSSRSAVNTCDDRICKNGFRVECVGIPDTSSRKSKLTTRSEDLHRSKTAAFNLASEGFLVSVGETRNAHTISVG
jgi:hypothetical protein